MGVANTLTRGEQSEQSETLPAEESDLSVFLTRDE